MSTMTGKKIRRCALVSLVLAGLFLAAACTPAEDASPSPEQRGLCEARCFAERGTCTADAYVCDRAEAACKRVCRRY